MASSGRVSPMPLLRRSVSSSSVGRNSSARFRSPERSSARIRCWYSGRRARGLQLERADAPGSAGSCCAVPGRPPPSVMRASRRLRSPARQAPSCHQRVEQDLDVHLDVRGVDAGGVVDEVGVEAAAGEGVLDAPALRAGRGCRLRRPPWPCSSRPLMRSRVVGAVADLGVALVARLDVGADAAVPQQVDRHAQDGADHVVGGGAAATRCPSSVRASRRQGDRLGACAGTRRRRARASCGRSRPSSSAAARTGARARRSSPPDPGSGSRKMCRWSKAACSRMCATAACRCRTRRRTCRRCRRR